MSSRFFFLFLNLYILLKSNTQIVSSQNVSINSNSKNISDAEFFETINNSSLSIKVDPHESARNKRALGIFLQGLVQALGYNTTPIQLATLTNPNTIGIPSGPVGIDVRSIPSPAPQASIAPPPSHTPSQRPTPMPLTTMTPRQRETLRFTGVVNFGNNSDIVGHLRQYERLFHGSSTAAPASTTSKPPPTSSTASPTPSAAPPSSSQAPLLQPYFVKIPLPLAESLRYPKPLIKLVTTPASPVPVDDANTEGIDQRKVPKQATSYSKERKNDKQINHTNPHVSCSLEEKVKGHNGGEKDNYGEGEREEVSGEYDDHKATSNDEGSEEEYSYEDKREEEPEQRPLHEEEKEVADGGEEGEELEDVEEEKEKETPENYSKEPLYMYEDPEIIPNKMPTATIDNFGMKLPIEIKPFQGQLMNSYGQSLEHGGKIDESVADYFARFKNPHSGIFDPLSAIAFEGQRRKLVSGEITGDSVEQIRGFVAPQFRYEEYDLENDRVGRANTQNIRAEEAEGEVVDNQDKADDAHNQNKQYLPKKTSQHLLKHENTRPLAREHQEIENSKERDPNKTFVLSPVELINYQPYYKPVQYYYSPDFGYDKYVDFKNEPMDEEKSQSLKKEIPEEDVTVERNVERKENIHQKSERPVSLEAVEKYEEKLSDKQSDQIEISDEKSSEKRPFVPEPFDFVRFQPYYKPVQYYYSPESLERTVQSITSRLDTKSRRNPEDRTEHVSNEHSREPRKPELVTSSKIAGSLTAEKGRAKKNQDKSSKIVQTNPEQLETPVTNRPRHLKRRKVNRNRNNSYNSSNDKEEDRKIVEQTMTKESRNSVRTRKIRPKSDQQ